MIPDTLLGGLGREEDHPLALVQDQPLDQHQAHEGLPETHPVAQERTAVLAGDLHERPVGLLLVAIEVREHPRARLVPLGRGQLVTSEELLQGLRIDVERRVEARVPLHGLDDRVGHLLGLAPVHLEPFLELGHLARALDLDVQLDVLGQTRACEVAGAHQRLCTHHLELRVRDVRLGVELFLVVDAALDLAGAEGFEDRRHPVKEGVPVLVRLDALVQRLERPTSHGFE